MSSHTNSTDPGPHAHIVGLPVPELAQRMADGDLTSQQLTQIYLNRITALDTSGPGLGSVLEVNPDALTIAASLDAERAGGVVRGPLHGIPVLVKDNIDTADAMHTTAGSLALMNSTPARDATVIAKLREAGAVILGKTNLSEWANFRSRQSSSGWSGRGITRNPHSLLRNPSGSSSGSAVAVAASLAPVSLGTETNGSIVSPGSASGVVGIKPTVGLTSRAGVIPISHSQDSVGTFGQSVLDAAITLAAIVGGDDRDPATSHIPSSFDPASLIRLDANALRGARLGVPANIRTTGYSVQADTIFAAALEVLRGLGAEIIPDIEIPSAEKLDGHPGQYERMLWEFRTDVQAYLDERNDPAMRSLADLIQFNTDHADQELPYFGQNAFEAAEAMANDDPALMRALDANLQRWSRDEGIDAVMAEYNLDALIAPTRSPAGMTDLVNGESGHGGASNLAAIAGYPIITVPAGLARGMPVGLSFFGTAWSDARLLNLAYAWEQATHMLRHPTYHPGDIVAEPSVPAYELPGR